MRAIKKLGFYCLVYFLAGCTSGHLEYVTPQGEKKVACETEYTWEPSVDKYAVEYIISYCAMRAVEKGNSVINKSLLTIDRKLPEPPLGKSWSHELAKQLHNQGQLTNKEYGYLIAALDLGHFDKENK